MTYRDLLQHYFSIHLSHLRNSIQSEYERVHLFWKQSYVNKYLPKDLDAKVLDVGCGLGFHLYALRRLGYSNLKGVDVSKEEIEIAKKNVDNVNFIVADVLKFPSNTDEKYDLIICFDLLEHLTKDEVYTVCRLLHNTLRESGTLLVRMPNASSPLSSHLRHDDITHESMFTERALREMLEFAGFSSVRVIGLRPFISGDRSFWRKVFKNLVYRPVLILSGLLIRLFYMSYGVRAKTVYPNIMGIAVK